MKFKLAGIKKHSVVDGEGVRFAVFFQGCPHHCPFCQNPDTWDASGGEEAETEEIIDLICNDPYIDGITLSGGDPLFQPEAAKEIAAAAKEKGLSVWCYSGWTFEEAVSDLARKEALRYVDVLVDGPFINDLKSTECIYRGSTNQRLVDVQKSLLSGDAVTL